MAKISINLLRWNSPWTEIHRCISAVLASDLEDFRLVYSENCNPDAPSLSEHVRACFGTDERLQILKNDTNLGYAGGHNKFFAETDCPLLMVLNPDAILNKSFLRNIVRAFLDPSVGAATGKMLKPHVSPGGERVLDGTGIEIYRTRRARERGQNDIDHGQFDRDPEIFGVSGTAAVYRKSALETVKIRCDEYFDTDFFAYWEDLDLSWRLRLAGFKCVYVPEAIVEHERAAGSSAGGLGRFVDFVRHHQRIPLQIRRWSWRNHLFAIIKNDQGWGLWRDFPFMLCREHPYGAAGFF
jgi:GT2 family glycosyltransferase